MGLARAKAWYNGIRATHVTRVVLNTIMSMHMIVDVAPLVKLNVVISVGMRIDVERIILLALDVIGS